MEFLQSRIDSFTKPRRVKNPTKSSFISVKWNHPPHPHFIATTETLAEAGFYFNPSFEDRDNVACFMCNKQLSDWEPEDDPFDIHWEKCGDRFKFTDKSRVPTSKVMERARLETFSVGDGWIHDQIKNHGSNSRKMARAGFVFTPTHPGDDLATCLYCNVSLSGWEANDDPLEEHQKRQEGSCPMFDPPEPASKPPSRAQSAKPSSKAQPVKNARSVSQSKHTDLMQPMKTHDGDPDESDAALPPSSSRRSTRAVSGPNKTAKMPKIARSQSRSELDDVAEDDENAEGGEDVAPRVGRAKANKSLATNKARSRSKSVAPLAAAEDQDDVEEIITKAPTKSRSKAKGKEKAPVEVEEEVAEETKSLKKSTRGRPPARSKQQEEDTEQEEVKVLKKSTRGRTPQRVEDTEEEEEDVTKTLKKSTRTKRPSRFEDAAAALRKASKTKKAKAPDPEPEPEPGLKPEPEPEPEVEATTEVEEAVVKPRAPSKSRAKTPAPGKPSRARPKAIPAPEAEEPEEAVDEHEEEQHPPPPPVVEKKKRTPSTSVKVNSKLTRTSSVAEKPASSSVKPSKPLAPHDEDDGADEVVVEEMLSPSVAETKKRAPSPKSSVFAKPKALQSKPKVKAPAHPPPPSEEETEGVDDDDDDEMDVFVSPRESPVPLPKKQLPPEKVLETIIEKEKERRSGDDESEMEPLFIPKRGAKPSKSSAKPTQKAADVDTDVEMEPVAAPKKVVKEAKSHVLGKENKPTKERPSSSSGTGRKGSFLKVVEISTDEEGGASADELQPTQEDIPPLAAPTVLRPAHETRPLTQTISQLSKEAPKKATGIIEMVPKPPVEPILTRVPSPSPPSPPHSLPEAEDVEMDDLEPEVEPLIATQPDEDVPAPQTPPRPTMTTPAPAPAPAPEPEPLPTTAPALPMPALSKLPFTPLQNLTEAELDMTVEEWIRYQIGVEYDKFRRDGEREIGRFKSRAEDVRDIIEKL
ncbi:hypothetical protein C0991_001691 [Blastosporella zonata]|nr:hypothetical protein C0991_001691 [Blastosporella zonata]